MEILLFILALITCTALTVTLIEFIFGFKQITNLSTVADINNNDLPTLSIIFAALNEEKDIEKSLQSLLNLNYPNLEIIAINDRSTDKTPEILDEYQKKYSERLRVFHIKELPRGWLGKNHALYFGSQQAKGDWLLFTDADVLMHNNLLIKAMSYALKNNIDHLTIPEKQISRHFWLSAFYLGQNVSYCLVLKPWRIRHKWSKRFLGHGAFNLINKKCYEHCNGHRAIALECLDDLQIGKLLKHNGFKQDTVDGRDFLEREWYKSLGDMICGLQKNAFAVFEYKLLVASTAILFGFLFYLWPFIGTILFTGPIRWLNLLNIGLTLVINLYVADYFRVQKRYAFFYPAAICILLYTVFNSMFSVYKNNGVIWRGTYYSLQQLRNKN